MAAPNAVPIASADGAVHPRAWKVALLFPGAVEPEVVVELAPPADVDCGLGWVPVVLELFEPLLPHAASITTTMPDRTSRPALITMGGEVTTSGQCAQWR